MVWSPVVPSPGENGLLGLHPLRQVQVRPVFSLLRLLVVIFFCSSWRLISTPQSFEFLSVPIQYGRKFFLLSPFSAPTAS